MEYPINQTACNRAKQDTNAWLLNHIVAWFLAFILPGVGTMLATIFIPPDKSIQIAALYGFLGGVAGLLLLFIGVYVWNLFRAPVKQRNEARALLLAKPKAFPLQNRESLIRAITLVEGKAIAVRSCQDWLNHVDEGNRDARIKAESAAADAHSAYISAMIDLQTERMIAGDYFRAIIDNFIMFINYHVYDCLGATKDKPATLKTMPFISELTNKIEETIRSLDAISLQVPHKEDYQKQ